MRSCYIPSSISLDDRTRWAIIGLFWNSLQHICPIVILFTFAQYNSSTARLGSIIKTRVDAVVLGIVVVILYVSDHPSKLINSVPETCADLSWPISSIESSSVAWTLQNHPPPLFMWQATAPTWPALVGRTRRNDWFSVLRSKKTRRCDARQILMVGREAARTSH